MVIIIVIKELIPIELLKLSLEYSISKKHQKSLIERINKLERKPVEENKPRKKVQATQESFL